MYTIDLDLDLDRDLDLDLARVHTGPLSDATLVS